MSSVKLPGDLPAPLAALLASCDGQVPQSGNAAPCPLRFRAIWISDIHLGTPGCQAAALLEFLRLTESRYLYLVGDIIDGWQLQRRWYWHPSHNDVIQKILRKARKGTEVVYIPGNHDEGARHFLELAFGGIDHSSTMQSTGPPTAGACSSPTAISSTESSSAPGGWHWSGTCSTPWC